MSKMNTGIINKHDLHLNGLVIPSIEYGNPRVLSKEPFVSVVMITYNHEDYIGQAIEHVARQETSFPFELIIGEDCSTDRTRQIVFEYQKKYPNLIRIIISEKNVGARRNLLRTEVACRGKYIAYCEGDDYWHDPRKLQIQVDFLESNPNYGLVCSDARSYTVETGTLLENAISRRPNLCRTDDPYLQRLTGAILIWPLTVCMRTDLLREIHRECPECSDEGHLMGDIQRYLEVAHRTKIKLLPDLLATRNLLPESASQSKSVAKKAAFVYDGGQIILHYLTKYPVAPAYDSQVRRWVHLRDLSYAYRCRNRERACESYRCLKQRGIRVSLRYMLYYYGALNSMLHRIVSGLFDVLRLIVKAKNLLGSFGASRSEVLSA